MKWKVEVRGKDPAPDSLTLLSRRLEMSESRIVASLPDGLTCGGLSESSAQSLADGLKRDRGIYCRVLPDESQPSFESTFKVLLVNYRPGYRTRLRRRLQELTRLPQEQIITWLSRMPFALSRGVDADTARRIKKAVTDAGGIIRVEEETASEGPKTGKKRSNAVFRSRGRSNETPGPADSLFTRREEPKKEDAPAPPVCSLPDEMIPGPPPLEEYGGLPGNVVMYPPSILAPGEPSISPDGGGGLLPPLLPDPIAGVPDEFQLSPPDFQHDSRPPVVGEESETMKPRGPFPAVALQYPPPRGLPASSLLPPVIPGGEGRISREPEIHEILSVNSGNDALNLYLCPPPADIEDRVSRVLVDILNISTRDSWDILRKSPALIARFTDHRVAIRKVRELESRGLTVTLLRGGSPERGRSASPGEGFRAWLLKNG